MEEIFFNGEHLFVGNLGKVFVALAFVSALFGTFAFWHANQSGDKTSAVSGRLAFIVHGISVLGIISTLFFIIYNHYFEYDYAWQHSSLSLPTHFMISCFWEGQEGSFLLWLFWQAVLGVFIIRKNTKWTFPVMTIIMLSQAVLASMLLGWKFGDYSFGSSPFILLRIKNPELLQLPVMIMNNIPPADYLKVITDGTGLNPLLQNYWMVIHPPTLFFGFATTIIPFAFAISALWIKDYRGWMRPALPWALISAAVLGTGIIMGGIWAYEALSFGGYWAWDPVENASLVPWLVLISGIHVILISRATGKSLGLAMILVMLTYILVLYATFLTRSGVLGDSSVHSFTDLGLSAQLLVFLFMFAILPTLVSFPKPWHRWLFVFSVLLIFLLNVIAQTFIVWLNGLAFIAALVLLGSNLTRHLPNPGGKDETVHSREFWMFIGSLILLLSAVQVTMSTSIPVFNKITLAIAPLFEVLHRIIPIEVFKNMAQGKIAKPVDAMMHYNRWQMPLAIIIALLSGLIQFFPYKSTSWNQIGKRLGIISAIAIVLTALLSWNFHFSVKSEFMLILFMFTAFFTITGNILFMVRGLKGNWTLSGASIAHIGFGLMLIGVLISSARKEVISLNERTSYGERFDAKETRQNILVMKNQPTEMGDYELTYRGDSVHGPNTYYQVDYQNKKTGEKFTLYPNAQYNEQQGLMPSPDTRHYLLKDIYTHVSSVPEHAESEDFWEDQEVHNMAIGDTIVVNRSIIILEGVEIILGGSISKDLNGHVLQVATLKVMFGDSVWWSKPVFGVKDGISSYNMYSIVNTAGLRFNYFPPEKTAEETGGKALHRIVTETQPPRYIIMKAIVFPYINFLWFGTIIMIVGFGVAIYRRKSETKKREA
ncbi:MAG: cytochrome C biogenesis protein [Bacteroidetes bacterium]|nr:cytochrome C biogenesis protein [Bacteroidota bacterium]